MLSSPVFAKRSPGSRATRFAVVGLALALGTTPMASIVATADAAQPAAVKRSPPEYPRGALARGIEGFVLVEFTVDGNGNVVSPKVVQGTPPGVFDAAAIAAINKWKYEPTGADNPSMQVKIDFKVAG